MNTKLNQSSYHILLKCGYTPSEASKVSGYAPTAKEIADANEAKYADKKIVADEASEKIRPSNVYSEIAAGADNGECTTRFGTYCKLKTGNGRFRYLHN